MTRIAEALNAADAGADAIGLVFYPASRRALDLNAAREIARATPPLISRVAVFLEPAVDYVARVVDALRPDLLQFHGRETPGFCAQFATPYIKSVPMGEPDVDLGSWAERYAATRALLLDANRAGEAGGQGACFHWSRSGERPTVPLILAGGLNADNVGASIAEFGPYAVDVSSGVEAADGRKSPARLRAFLGAVQAASRE